MASAPDPAALNRAYGRAVRERREELDLSQEELSFRSELDRTYISGIERGVRNPTIRSMCRIAGALSVLPSRLVASAERMAALQARSGRR